MEFKGNEAIYLQIAGHVSDCILVGKWPIDQRIPSVRELATDLQVNHNTVVRTYELLQQQDIIYNKRGLGFFVAPEAPDKVKHYRRERFLQQELPAFFTTISLLGISLDELQERYAQFQRKHPDSIPSKA